MQITPTELFFSSLASQDAVSNRLSIQPSASVVERAGVERGSEGWRVNGRVSSSSIFLDAQFRSAPCISTLPSTAGTPEEIRPLSSGSALEEDVEIYPTWNNPDYASQTLV